MGDLHYANLDVNDVRKFRLAYDTMFASDAGKVHINALCSIMIWYYTRQCSIWSFPWHTCGTTTILVRIIATPLLQEEMHLYELTVNTFHTIHFKTSTKIIILRRQYWFFFSSFFHVQVGWAAWSNSTGIYDWTCSLSHDGLEIWENAKQSARRTFENGAWSWPKAMVHGRIGKNRYFIFVHIALLRYIHDTHMM